MPHLLLSLLLFGNLANRKEKPKINKEQRIEIKNLRKKFQQNFVKFSILAKKLEKNKTKQKQTKTKPNCTSQKVIFY